MSVQDMIVCHSIYTFCSHSGDYNISGVSKYFGHLDFLAYLICMYKKIANNLFPYVSKVFPVVWLLKDLLKLFGIKHYCNNHQAFMYTNLNDLVLLLQK